MAGVKVNVPLPDEIRCKRSDGKRWQCSLPPMEGKIFCQAHYLQSRHRQLRKPVPDSLKLDRATRNKLVPKLEEESNDLPRRGGKRKRAETSTVPRKRGKKDKSILNPEKAVVKELKYGLMEIPQASPSSAQLKRPGSPKSKIGVAASQSVLRRPIRSKNVEPIPMATLQMLPSIKANIREAVKKKNHKKCHWCKWSSYRVLVKCSTCKTQFFCVDCIDERFYDKAAVKRECPVCLGTCWCRACIRERLKEDKSKELVVCSPEKDLVVHNPDMDLVVHNPEEELVVCSPEKDLVVHNPDMDLVVHNPEEELVVYNREKKFDKIQQLHLIRMLLPVMEKMNQEKIIALDTEAKNKGRMLGQLQVELAECSQKRKCSFCDDWVADLHRSCISCSYILCMLCCQEFSDGYLHSGLADLKNTKMIRSKAPRKKISWRFCADGSIRCPPKDLGGCGEAFLKLACFPPFNWTKDLEASARQIVFKYRFKKPFGIASSPCLLCEENNDMGSEKVGNLIKDIGLYFSTKQDFKDKNLEHFMKHWGEGQPLIIRDVLQSRPDLSWDFGFMFCEYLERSAESCKDTERVKSKSRSDWCEVQFGRKHILVGGKTHANVWQEFLKFKVRFSSGFFQEQFPDHYAAVMQALPVEEYLNPLTGFLNLAANLRTETQNLNLGPCIHISYGGPEDFMDSGHLTKLCRHPVDMMNILANATTDPISETKLNDVKILMKKYTSEDHLQSSSKIRTRLKLEEIFGSLTGLEDGERPCMTNSSLHLISDDSSTEDSGDEDFSQNKIRSCSTSRYGEEQVIDTCGAQWDIFRREDVPKLVEYLRKYSDKLRESYGSPGKVVHPLFDEVYHLDDLHKTRLKEEFDVEPWSFEQHIGEAVIIPAGCPYQMKKIKSCVNVVLEFISPESASECIEVGNEVRQLPVNHKAKGKRIEVKKMVINGMHAAIEEIRTVSQTGLVKAEG
ncbi:lysine-specific demethylase JMJ25-like isoform X1 [Cynara cardunculus var. scolymus]|uniref:lysine-specific demethylase JMJ25-like isoform X1 n=1 Tax=Cynara cardunculus var. scolymus TaxID=59895 RepID=UPI000D6314C0|nr:lysine-specific demethylase JMJ25-like isoform X1 [Cynara cardunculus var. scolymus]